MENPEIQAIKGSIRPRKNAELRAKRKEFGFSTEQFAELLGISRTTLYRLEREPEKVMDFQLSVTMRYLSQYFKT